MVSDNHILYRVITPLQHSDMICKIPRGYLQNSQGVGVIIFKFLCISKGLKTKVFAKADDGFFISVLGR